MYDYILNAEQNNPMVKSFKKEGQKYNYLLENSNLSKLTLSCGLLKLLGEDIVNSSLYKSFFNKAMQPQLDDDSVEKIKSMSTELSSKEIESLLKFLNYESVATTEQGFNSHENLVEYVINFYDQFVSNFSNVYPYLIKLDGFDKITEKMIEFIKTEGFSKSDAHSFYQNNSDVVNQFLDELISKSTNDIAHLIIKDNELSEYIINAIAIDPSTEFTRFLYEGVFYFISNGVMYYEYEEEDEYGEIDVYELNVHIDTQIEILNSDINVNQSVVDEKFIFIAILNAYRSYMKHILLNNHYNAVKMVQFSNS